MLGELGDGSLDQRHIQRKPQAFYAVTIIWHYYIRGGGGSSIFIERDIRGMQKAGHGGALGFLGRCSLDDDTVTMVDFVLDDLGGPAGEVFDVSEMCIRDRC